MLIAFNINLDWLFTPGSLYSVQLLIHQREFWFCAHFLSILNFSFLIPIGDSITIMWWHVLFYQLFFLFSIYTSTLFCDFIHCTRHKTFHFWILTQLFVFFYINLYNTNNNASICIDLLDKLHWQYFWVFMHNLQGLPVYLRAPYFTKL